MGESTGISWTDHTFVRPATSGPQPKPARSGDKLQARQRVNVEVRSGRRPHPNTLPCTDCGHVADCADLGVARAAQPDMPARASEIIADVSGASPELQAAIAAHSVQYVTVRVFDTCSEDGDVVSLSTDTGATFGPFTISNAGSTVSIPVVGGRAPRITLHALKDGNGGITVGATTSMGTWYSGILPEGGTQIVSMIDR